MSLLRPWNSFFESKTRELFAGAKLVVDIGEGLRARPDRGSRYDSRRSWATELIKKVDYKALDPVSDYNPELIGDIHNLPLNDASVDSLICLAVLEHVEDPFLAVQQMRRVLRPNGALLVYVPFLFYYHADPGYYKDFWRFTGDGVDRLFSGFASVEKCPVRGPLETYLHFLLPGKLSFLHDLAFVFDKRFKDKSMQVSGYYVFCRK